MLRVLNRHGKNEYLVLDTSDGVIEPAGFRDILSLIQSGVPVEGISKDGESYVFDCDGARMHKVHKGYRLRLYPNKAQETMIAKTFGCCRFLYNKMLEDMMDGLDKGLRVNVSQADYKEEFPWLGEVDSQALAMERIHLRSAFSKHYKEGNGFPKYKRKADNNQSYSTHSSHGAVRFEEGRIRLPKVGFIRVRPAPPCEGKLGIVTVSRVPSGKYFLSFQLEEWVLGYPSGGGEIGLDLGVKDFVVTSSGKVYENKRVLDRYAKRLARAQQRLSGMQKGSHNWEKQRKVVARIHEKVANIRRDYIHKVSHELVEENQLIVSEDLNVQGLMKNHRLAGAISDVSWYELTRQLSYKSDWYGRRYLKVGRYYPSTQTCSVCGYVNKDLRGSEGLSIRAWDCPVCGTHHDRDLNAAINILNEGKKLA